jgi:hypothetical protein
MDLSRRLRHRRHPQIGPFGVIVAPCFFIVFDAVNPKNNEKTHEKTTPQKTRKKSPVTFSEIIEAEKLAASLGVSANKRCYTIQYNTIQYHTIPYNTIQ